jgi:hypothetical protein
LGEDLEQVGAYLIPMLDETLARMLRQIRIATATVGPASIKDNHLNDSPIPT